jgi:polyisoprenoid-binding protein YceI
MRSSIFAALASIAALPAAADPETFTIDPNHTFPSWEVGHMGLSIQRGRFNRTMGKVTVDTAAKTGTAEIVIDASSLDTGHPKLGEHLRGEQYFNVEKFPTLAFKAAQFTFEGDKVRAVAGDFTMLGVTRPVTLTAVTFNCALNSLTKKKVCGGDFVGTLKRSEFGLTRSMTAVTDEVTLHVNFEAIKD